MEHDSFMMLKNIKLRFKDYIKYKKKKKARSQQTFQRLFNIVF